MKQRWTGRIIFSMIRSVKILGIETSCDETAAAIVELTENRQLRLLSNVVASSMDLHVLYGGVVPEIAARSHIEHMMPTVQQALQSAFPSVADPWDEIDGVAVTQGPGLGGSLLVGVMTARTLAVRKQKPLYEINHVMAHPFAAFITEGMADVTYPEQAPDFPMLSLIVSGGHSQLVLFDSPLKYQVLGRTRDDAVGEAFDKVAKILGLPYPGGPSIGKKAMEGNPKTYEFPTAKLDGKYDFSFSGLKTAVLRLAQKEIGEDHHFPSTKLAGRLSEAQKADIAAGFQYSAIRTLVEKTVAAYDEFAPKSVVIAGGVAASPELRRQLSEALPIPPIYPDMKLCTDNGAMIAALGCLMQESGSETSDPYSLDIRPSWPM